MADNIYPEIRPEVLERFIHAARSVEGKTGGPRAMVETMTDLVKSYKDQFVDMYFPEDAEEARDPYTILSIYKVMRDAMDLYIRNQMELFHLDLTADEIGYYFQCELSREKEKAGNE